MKVGKAVNPEKIPRKSVAVKNLKQIETNP
jgi:hypothetical protein